MSQSINKFIKEANNNINYLSQLKNEVKVKKISYASDMYFLQSLPISEKDYNIKYKRIITKKLKHFLMVNYSIQELPKNKMM